VWTAHQINIASHSLVSQYSKDDSKVINKGISESSNICSSPHKDSTKLAYPTSSDFSTDDKISNEILTAERRDPYTVEDEGTDGIEITLRLSPHKDPCKNLHKLLENEIRQDKFRSPQRLAHDARIMHDNIFNIENLGIKKRISKNDAKVKEADIPKDPKYANTFDYDVKLLNSLHTDEYNAPFCLQARIDRTIEEIRKNDLEYKEADIRKDPESAKNFNYDVTLRNSDPSSNRVETALQSDNQAPLSLQAYIDKTIEIIDKSYWNSNRTGLRKYKSEETVNIKEYQKQEEAGVMEINSLDIMDQKRKPLHQTFPILQCQDLNEWTSDVINKSESNLNNSVNEFVNSLPSKSKIQFEAPLVCPVDLTKGISQKIFELDTPCLHDTKLPCAESMSENDSEKSSWSINMPFKSYFNTPKFHVDNIMRDGADRVFEQGKRKEFLTEGKTSSNSILTDSFKFKNEETILKQSETTEIDNQNMDWISESVGEDSFRTNNVLFDSKCTHNSIFHIDIIMGVEPDQDFELVKCKEPLVSKVIQIDNPELNLSSISDGEESSRSSDASCVSYFTTPKYYIDIIMGDGLSPDFELVKLQDPSINESAISRQSEVVDIDNPRFNLKNVSSTTPGQESSQSCITSFLSDSTSPKHHITSRIGDGADKADDLFKLKESFIVSEPYNFVAIDSTEVENENTILGQSKVIESDNPKLDLRSMSSISKGWESSLSSNTSFESISTSSKYHNTVIDEGADEADDQFKLKESLTASEAYNFVADDPFEAKNNHVVMKQSEVIKIDNSELDWKSFSSCNVKEQDFLSNGTSHPSTSDEVYTVSSGDDVTEIELPKEVNFSVMNQNVSFCSNNSISKEEYDYSLPNDKAQITIIDKYQPAKNLSSQTEIQSLIMKMKSSGEVTESIIGTFKNLNEYDAYDHEFLDTLAQNITENSRIEGERVSVDTSIHSTTSQLCKLKRLKAKILHQKIIMRTQNIRNNVCSLNHDEVDSKIYTGEDDIANNEHDSCVENLSPPDMVNKKCCVEIASCDSRTEYDEDIASSSESIRKEKSDGEINVEDYQDSIPFVNTHLRNIIPSEQDIYSSPCLEIRDSSRESKSHTSSGDGNENVRDIHSQIDIRKYQPVVGDSTVSEKIGSIASLLERKRKKNGKYVSHSCKISADRKSTNMYGEKTAIKGCFPIKPSNQTRRKIAPGIAARLAVLNMQ